MNAITPTTTTRLSLTGEFAAEGIKLEAIFSPDDTDLIVGKNSLSIPRGVWHEIVAKSAVYDAVLAGEPVPVVESISRAAPVTSYPELGAPIGGGFCAGRHPGIEGAVLIVSDKMAEAKGMAWKAANDHCAAYLGGGFTDWRAPDRLESLILQERLGAPITQVSTFKKGEVEAFAEEWYWTNQESQFYSDCAWSQSFGAGSNYGLSKLSVCRVRPVRIHFI